MLKGSRLHGRRPREAARGHRHDVDRDDALQLEPARAHPARQARDSSRRRYAARVQHDLRLRRRLMGTEGMRASLVSREVIADSIELVAHGHLFDGLVCLVGCDKTIPAAVMALCRLDIPGLVLYSGSIAPGRPRARRHDSGVPRQPRRRGAMPSRNWRRPPPVRSHARASLHFVYWRPEARHASLRIERG